MIVDCAIKKYWEINILFDILSGDCMSYVAKIVTLCAGTLCPGTFWPDTKRKPYDIKLLDHVRSFQLNRYMYMFHRTIMSDFHAFLSHLNT